MVQIIHWAHLPYFPHVSLAHELALLHAPLLKRFQVVASITYLSQVMFPSMAQISISLANFFGIFLGKICFLGIISVKFSFIRKNLPVFQTRDSKKKSWLPRYLPKKPSSSSCDESPVCRLWQDACNYMQHSIQSYAHIVLEMSLAHWVVHAKILCANPTQMSSLYPMGRANKCIEKSRNI